ncbi:V-type immunoglobulin domain-containing suppressor of T-cell activation [Eucyclogobius newberryi]|uniref:V-type immunoglobulin domain-containing suppressor of T-cell activation n=1 Tax=Eucyclogobius newberryi TaxID=166745 RepID=UPI003B5BDA2C
MTRWRRVCALDKAALLCALLLTTARADTKLPYSHPTLEVSAPHMYYTCPEGATVKLVCNQGGALKYPTDKLHHSWFFTQQSDQHCSNHIRPRNIGHKLPPGVHVGASAENFWLSMANVTYSDQGRYCCVVLDVQDTKQHKVVHQRPHSHVMLTVTPRRNGSQECTYVDPTPPGGAVPVALAVAACVLALLSLPLILVLVYKQRQSVHSSRCAQELVRMDSETQGHENPVFLGGSPQGKPRTVSQIMTRQSSETGRHLLSDPGTPLSPPGHGDVFFPSDDTIPESPDLL